MLRSLPAQRAQLLQAQPRLPRAARSAVRVAAASGARGRACAERLRTSHSSSSARRRGRCSGGAPGRVQGHEEVGRREGGAGGGSGGADARRQPGVLRARGLGNGGCVPGGPAFSRRPGNQRAAGIHAPLAGAPPRGGERCAASRSVAHLSPQPLSLAAVGRALWVNYKITDKRVSVTSTSCVPCSGRARATLRLTDAGPTLVPGLLGRSSWTPPTPRCWRCAPSGAAWATGETW